MMGTFGGALEARQIDARNGKENNRARAWHLRIELPSLPYLAQGDPTHIFFRAGDYLRRLPASSKLQQSLAFMPHGSQQTAVPRWMSQYDRRRGVRNLKLDTTKTE